MNADSTLNNTLSGKQTRFRGAVASSRKKKAHALVPKISVKSKTIGKGEAYALHQLAKKRRLSKKAKGLSTKARHTFNPMRANRALSNRDRKKANKSLWDSTHGSRAIKENLSDMSDDDEDASSEDSGLALLNKSQAQFVEG